jgi:hypothetical protein
MTIHDLEPWQVRFCAQNNLSPEEYLEELEYLFSACSLIKLIHQ